MGFVKRKLLWKSWKCVNAWLWHNYKPSWSNYSRTCFCRRKNSLKRPSNGWLRTSTWNATRLISTRSFIPHKKKSHQSIFRSFFFLTSINTIISLLYFCFYLNYFKTDAYEKHGKYRVLFLIFNEFLRQIFLNLFL